MDSNDHNEYEIIDSHVSSYSPNRNNQYSNFKYPYRNVCNTPDKIDWSAATSTMIIVGGTLLGAIGSGGVGIVAAGIISVGTLLPLFWPKDQPYEKVWEEFIQQGNTLTTKEISATVKSLVLAELNGLRSVYNVYMDALNLWKQDKNNITNRENVKNIFINLHLQCVAAMSKFSTTNYEVILLSTYTAAAILHITFLHEALQYANEWELAARSEGTFYREQLIQAIETYINYCEKWYHEGLKQLESSTWDAYNAYQNEYTLSVLYIISQIPRFDMRYYPTDIPTRLEFTQKLYTTTPNMKALQTNDAINYIKKNLIPPLDLFKKLNILNFHTFLDTNNRYNYLQGIQNYSSYTNSSSNIIFNSGNITGIPASIGLSPNQVIYFADIFHHLNLNTFETGSLGIKNIHFNIINENNSVFDSVYNSNATNNLILEVILPYLKKGNELLTEKNYKYILSYITISPQQIRDCMSNSYIYGFIWTDSSVNLNNTINFKDKNNNPQITQISAVKAYTKSGNGISVIEGPGHTGGDLIKFTQWYDSIHTRYRFTSSNEYKIRIRYASTVQVNQVAAIVMRIYHQDNPIDEKALKITNTPDTILNLNEPRYNHFQYVEFPNTLIIKKSSNSPYLELPIQLSHQGLNVTTLIDKIEFIPIT
ncbi:insecticidal delta-endotoxin Cry8Ea1 family protein [Bacillus mycoides]|uniref:insecticidal delta-endotoxin Cry8Ea1 family protein n=1 Tax=Bacillus mycoides TaxID=1405 RepID=UPI003CFF05C9